MKRSLTLACFVVAFAAHPAFAAETVISSPTTWSSNQSFDELRVTAGTTVTVSGNIVVTANKVTVETGATVSADGQGPLTTDLVAPGRGANGGDSGGGGGGHGGKGGDSALFGSGAFGSGGGAHGTALSGATMGGAGGNGGTVSSGGNPGGRGGGAITFNVAGDCRVDGVIRSNGLAGTDGVDNRGGGGGAGGSVVLRCNAIMGGGSFHANGGDGGGSFRIGGGGAGGRVLLDAPSVSGIMFPELSSVVGGARGGVGQHGSMLIVRRGAARPDDVITVNEGADFRGTDLPLVTAQLICQGARIRFGSTATVTIPVALDVTGCDVDGGPSLTVNAPSILLQNSAWSGTRLVLNTTTFLLDATSSITSNGQGPTLAEPHAGASPSPAGDWGGGGGGHAGPGGAGANVNPVAGTAGASHGDALNPDAPGGAGGTGGVCCGVPSPHAVGGRGGGVVRIQASGTCTVDGPINTLGASGNAVTQGFGGGGGAGGSIKLDCDVLVGGGELHADGGSGGTSTVQREGGGGSGGRIAVLARDLGGYLSLTRATARGGISRFPGERGSISVVARGSTASDNTLTALGYLELTGTYTSLTVRRLMCNGGSLKVPAGVSAVVTASQAIDLVDCTVDAPTAIRLVSPATSLVRSTATGSLVEVLGGTFSLDATSRLSADGQGPLPADVHTGRSTSVAGDTGGGGGGHGGAGGNGGAGALTPFALGGVIHDDAFDPVAPGGAGGTGGQCCSIPSPFAVGVRGGGVVRVNVTGACDIDGVVSSNGASALSVSDRGGGGGAGGTVNVRCGVISGDGRFVADGGSGGSSLISRGGGGGGGGRVLVTGTDLAQLSSTTSSARGGTGFLPGGAGSALFVTRGASPGTDAVHVFSGLELVASRNPYSFSSFQCTGAALRATGFDATLNVSGAVIGSSCGMDASQRFRMNAGSFSLASSDWRASTLEVNTTGAFTLDSLTTFDVSARGPTSVSGAHAGRGGNGGADEAGSGGGHGGRGADGILGSGTRLGTGGAAFDNPFDPLLPGGSGGQPVNGAAGGNGGGVVLVNAGGACSVSAQLLANGGNGAVVGSMGGGGGAGGTVSLRCGALSGSGLLRADGGDGGNGSTRAGGAGAGGRLFISASDLSGFTPVSASFARGSTRFGTAPAQSGSVLFIQRGATSATDTLRTSGLDLPINTPIIASRFECSQGHVRAQASGDTELRLASLAQFDGCTMELDRHRLVAQTLQLENSSNLRAASFDVSATDVEIDRSSILRTDGRGFAGGVTGSCAGQGTGGGAGGSTANIGGGGGGHAGRGGDGAGGIGAVGGNANDEARTATLAGSGGGCGGNGLVAGGAGGGVIRIVATGTLQLDGLISSQGLAGTLSASQGAGGGGAGGSIFVDAATITGIGRVSVSGGAGGTSSAAPGGGGSGGMAWLTANTITLADHRQSSARGGMSSFPGASGSLGFFARTGSTLTIVDGFVFTDGATPHSYTHVTALPGSGVRGIATATGIDVTGTLSLTQSRWDQSGDITVRSANTVLTESVVAGNAQWRVQGAGLTLTNSTISSRTVLADLADLDLDASSSIHSDAISTLTTGTGQNALTTDSGGAGGSHGGRGGPPASTGAVAQPATVYGNALVPATAGSQGASGMNSSTPVPGGLGGGYVRIAATDTCRLDGVITANGGAGTNISERSGGGGSGGSIHVLCHDLAGLAQLQANGGSALSNARPGGGGGGGRIFVEYDQGGLAAPQLSTVRGGLGANSGGPGTLMFTNRTTGAAQVVGGFSFNNSDGPQTYGQLEMLDAVVTTPGGVVTTVTATAPIVFTRSTMSSTADVVLAAPSLSLVASTLRARRIDFTGTSARIDIASSMDVSGLGDQSGTASPGVGVNAPNDTTGGGGGGHGGKGGSGLNSTGVPTTQGGASFDDSLDPISAGAAGGDGRISTLVIPGGSGGGIIRMRLTGALELDGSLVADGRSGTPNGGYCAGGGAGGTVNIQADTLSGAGSLSARGGEPTGCTVRVGGAGGGGRIAVTYRTGGLTRETLTTVRSTTGLAGGQSGSAVFVATGDDSLHAYGLTVSATQSPLSYRSIRFDSDQEVRLATGVVVAADEDLTVDRALVTGEGAMTLQGPALSLRRAVVNGADVLVAGRDVLVDGQSIVTTTGRGLAASTGAGAGADCPLVSDCGGGGGGHGGKGGGGQTTTTALIAGGAINDLDDDPVLFGSGGGRGGAGAAFTVAGGAGGGRIRISAAETLVVDGSLRADGADGADVLGRSSGAGAGGSIVLRTSVLSGFGSVRAVGGSSPAASITRKGGGGGGGRVVVCSTSGTLADPSAVDVSGGNLLAPDPNHRGDPGSLFQTTDCPRPPLASTVVLSDARGPVSAGGAVAAGRELTFTATLRDPNGILDLGSAVLDVLGDGRLVARYTPQSGFSLTAGGSLAQLMSTAADATVDVMSEANVLRFRLVPGFQVGDGPFTPSLLVTDLDGGNRQDVAPAFEVDRTIRPVSLSVREASGRSLSNGDAVGGGAQLTVVGAYEYGITHEPVANEIGLQGAIVLGGQPPAGSFALSGGQFEGTFTVPSSSTASLTVGSTLIAASVPAGALLEAPLSPIDLVVDADGPTVDVLTLSPSRVTVAYQGPVTVTLHLSDTSAGVTAATPRVDFSVGSHPLDGEEAMTRVQPGQWQYTIADQGWDVLGGATLLVNVSAPDNVGNVTLASRSLVIGSTNGAPTISSTAPTTATEGTLYTYTVLASDPDGDALHYMVVRGPTGLSVGSDGVVSWLPAFDQVGPQEVVLRVMDAQGSSSEQTFTVTVQRQDADGDGMADTLERAFGLNPLQNDSAGDKDGDGLTNTAELASGTDPSSNHSPSIPAVRSPRDGARVSTLAPTLVAGPASDPEQALLRYGFELWRADETDRPVTLVWSINDVVPSPTEVSVRVSTNTVSEGDRLLWRVRAFDGDRFGPWSEAGLFRVDATNVAPPAPRLLSPMGGGQARVFGAVLEAAPVIDPDGDDVTYRVEVYADGALTQSVEQRTGLLMPRHTLTTPLTDGENFHWRMQAIDSHGLAGPFSAVSSFTALANSSNRAPTPPTVVSPRNDVRVPALGNELVVTNGNDADGDSLAVRFEWSLDAAFAELAADAVVTPQGGLGSTRVVLDALQPGTTYHWRARTEDGKEASAFVSTSFRVDGAAVAPCTPMPWSPVDGAEIAVMGGALRFAWCPDARGLPVTFDVTVTDTFAPAQPLVSLINLPAGTGLLSDVVLPDTLPAGHAFLWRVRAVNSEGMASPWSDPATCTTYGASLLNEPPLAPAPDNPIGGNIVATRTPVLRWRNAMDPDGNPLTYTAEVYSDENLTSQVAALNDVAQGATGSFTQVVTNPALDDLTTYWWRVRANDGRASGPWSSVESFRVELFANPDAGTPDAGAEADGGGSASSSGSTSSTSSSGTTGGEGSSSSGGGGGGGDEPEERGGCAHGMVGHGVSMWSLLLLVVVALRRRRS